MKKIHLTFLLAGTVAASMSAHSLHAEDAVPASAPVAAVAPPKMDFLDAAYVPGFESVVVTGHHGLVGLLKVGETEARIKVIPDTPDEDFTALAKYTDNEVLLGSSTGRLYRFDGSKVSEIAALSEYDEPVLDIGVAGSAVWVVGARGLIAYSSDGNKFENIEIRDVTMPVTTMPGGQPADWYFGVSNIDAETIEFTATVGGEPAIDEEHYIMFPDEGFIQNTVNQIL